ncbi:MAG: hypothetical protein LBL84_00870 [Candidatus Nomurabacteria bacterium]|jgi:hypothetical protein|nr:hypothetical protein [Candidatus Nomurabacteria bacterium]
MSFGREPNFEQVEVEVPKTVLVDKQRAFEVLDTLMEAYENKQPPYDTFVPPQELEPDCLKPDGELYGTTQHAMYLWNACAYMSATDSNMSFQHLTELFYSRPELFDCDSLQHYNEAELGEVLRLGVPLGRHHSVAKTWIENAHRLAENHDGNPLNVFNDVASYDECLKKLRNDGKGGGFRGFQAKMVSMILYYYQGDGLLPKSQFPVPVDLHVLRVALATEMVKPNVAAFHRTPVVEDSIRDLTLSYIEERDVDPLVLTDAMWGLSSSFCNRQPGNIARSKKIGGRIFHAFTEIDHENPQQSKAWHNTCGRCALNAFCVNDIPSAPYYKSGTLAIRLRPEGEYVRQALSDES